MKILHAANLDSWLRVGEPFNQAGKFGKKLWHQNFRDPSTDEVAEYVAYSQPHWALTCPVLESGDLILVQEWKQGFEGVCTSFPAGTLEDGEGFVATAERETAEESGVIVGEKLIPLGESFIATRNSSTKYGMFIALGCSLGGEQKLDQGEYIQVIRVTQKEFWEMVDRGEIPCGCSVDLAARAVRQGYLDVQAMLR